ncbi:MAG: hypothetical protein GEU99_08340 [Luteitalea sp.]|nr:hypothetical protein [Luteitalea sp.]
MGLTGNCVFSGRDSVHTRPRLSRSSLPPMIIGLTVLATILAGTSATAQTLYGSVVGRVTDAQNNVLPGATVTIVNVDTNFTQESTTDGRGTYSFVNVPPGRHDVTIALEGFREAVRSNVPVTVGQISRVDTTLEVGALTETVTVTSAAELLQTDTAEVKTSLKTTEIQNLPLNQFRNYQSLIVLVPGSLPPTFQNAEADTPQRSLAMTVNAQTGNANATRTDGTTNVLVTNPHHTMYVPPAETIDTVNITTGSMDAEEGMAAGAAITVTTKSGTNTFSGSAFEFFNNETLNATPYYFGRGEAPEKLPLERQTFGGTLGGPIRRDQLFFFGAYEGHISRREQFLFFDVPDAALRNGDFNQALNADGTRQRIYDPMTGDLTTGTGRTPFPNNVIPADRIHPTAKDLVAMYPEPNVEGTGAGGLSDNYRTTQRIATDRHNVDLKINWNRTSAHQVWGKFSHMSALVDDLFTFPIGSADDDGGDTKVFQVTAGQTWTLGPTLLLDSAFGASSNDVNVTSPDFGLGMLGLDLGIPGTNDQGAGDPRYAGMPTFSTGFTALGNTPGWSPIFRNEHVQSFTTNITKIAGRHDVKAGYLLNHMTVDTWQPVANARGQFSFAGNATRTFGTGSQIANFYNEYGAFLLGLVGSAGKSLQFENFSGNEWQHALYVRDRWTVTPKLTVDLGVRWEYYPMMRRANRQIEMLDLDTLDVLIGGVGGNPDNMGLVAPKDMFAPRAGVVYRLNDKTVARAGFGVTYDGQGMAGEHALYGLRSYPQVINADHQTPAAQATFGWYDTLDQGIPLIDGPDVREGRVALPNDTEMKTAVPESTDRGKTYSWNVALERRLPLVSVDVAYVSNRVRDGLADININNAQTLGGGGLDRPYLVSHGRQLPIIIFTPYKKIDYDALQVGITRPFTDGLLLKGHYTYSRSWGRGTSLSGSVYGAQPQYELPTPEAEERNWIPEGGSRPHTFTMAFLYQLPWQSTGFRQNVAKTLISDWQVNGVFMAFSGTPFTVTADGTELNTPGNLQTADLVGPVTKVGEIGADGVYYDASAWAQPEGVRFGNTGPNQFRGPGGWNLDFSVFRAFPLSGTHRLEARIEATNVTDTPKFENPNGDIVSGDFMRIFSLNGAFTERQIRLGLRYSF